MIAVPRDRPAWAPHAIRRTVVPAASLVAVFMLVLAFAQLLLTRLDVKEYLIPRPLTVLDVFQDEWQTIGSNAITTIEETLIGFCISVAIGLLGAIAVVYIPALKRFIYPTIVTIQTMPIIAIAPLLIVWFGFGMLPKVITVIILATFPILISAASGLESVDPNMTRLISCMGGGRITELRRVRFFSAVPSIASGMKVGVSLAVVGAVVGEFVGADRGLGYLLVVANANLQTGLMFAVLVTLCGIGLALFVLITVVFQFIPGYRHHN